MSKPLKIGIYVLLAFLVMFFAWYVFFNYAARNGMLVKWEGRWYTREQLKQVVPPQVYSVESKNTPEEAYAAFRAALLANDIEGALGQMREESRARYEEAFRDKEKLDAWVKRLPEDFIKEKEDGNYSYYDWNKNDGYKHTVIFVKSNQGYWQIDSI